MLKILLTVSVINSNGNCSQELKRKKSRLRLGRAAMEELGKIAKSKEVSLESFGLIDL